MISIRYHVFSLIAVFLALAIGLAAGSTVVKESIVDNLRDNQDRLESELDDLQAANEELELRVGRLEETDRRLRGEGPLALLDARLLGMAIVVVTGEGLDGDVRTTMMDTLADAGADLAGEIEVRRDMVREERRGELAELVGAAPAEDAVAVAARSLATALAAVDAPDATFTTDSDAEGGDTQGGDTQGGAAEEPDSNPVDRGGDADDAATTEPPPVEEPPTEEPSMDDAAPSPERVALDDLLGALEDGGFVSADGAVADAEALIARAPMFVIVGGRPDSDDVTVTPFLTELVADIVAADDGRARVVVGDAALVDPAASRSPFVEAVQELGEIWDQVTSVDDLEVFAGMAALTLGIDDLRFGRTGHYGVGEAAESLLPVDP
jgi:Copper transport outer membrane protein, MctB